MNGISVAAPLNDKKIVRAWYMFDWANSVYSLVITSSIFPLYFKAVAKTGNSDLVDFFGFSLKNSTLLSYTISVSFLIVATILPFLSGMADYSGRKKSFMMFFVWLGALSCMGFYFFDSIGDLNWAITCALFANIGYSGSLVFYDAFLKEIVTEDRYDKTSARGYSMGYYGSVIMMLLSLVLIFNYQTFGFETEGSATRFVFLAVGVWWIGFSLIPFAILPESPRHEGEETSLWTKGYQEIRKVWQSLSGLPDLKKYLWSFFFFNMGVQTVMFLATLFGTDVLHLGSAELIPTILIIQLVGAIGAVLFARLSGKKGNRFTLTLLITIWIGICIGAYFITNKYEFFALAAIVGLVMGGIQALARATYSKLIPEGTNDTSSYFSFYDVTWNLSLVVGTFSYGLIDQITGSMRYSALALAVYFIIGMFLLRTVKSQKIGK
jgi:MFS transporter, UMF1 family